MILPMVFVLLAQDQQHVALTKVVKLQSVDVPLDILLTLSIKSAIKVVVLDNTMILLNYNVKIVLQLLIVVHLLMVL